jgi:hypothetical protein
MQEHIDALKSWDKISEMQENNSYNKLLFDYCVTFLGAVFQLYSGGQRVQ